MTEHDEDTPRERGPYGELHPERDTEFGRLSMTDSGITLNLGGTEQERIEPEPEDGELKHLADLVGVRVGELAGDEASVSEEPFDHAALEQLNAELDARAGATDPNPSLDLSLIHISEPTRPAA